jgi:DNA polymerase III subunit alpha
MTTGPFVSLHNHTELGSPLDGMNDTFDLFRRAKEVDHPAVAVTDHGTLTAMYDAYLASQETGVKLIPGMEAYFVDDLESRKSYHLVLLAQNEIGYKNILTLNYLAFQNQVSGYMGKKTPRITWEHINSYNEGVIALTACSNGLVGKTLITERDEATALKYVTRFKAIFNDRFFLELQPHALHAVQKNGKEVNQQKLNESLLKISSDYDIPYVITCDAHYRDKEHAKYHDFMLAIKDKKAVDDPDRFRYGVQDMYLKTGEEIIDFFGPKIAQVGMGNSIKIMQSCREPHYIAPSGPKLPTFPVQKQEDYDDFLEWKKKLGSTIPEDKAYLRFKCIEGFKENLSHLPAEDKEMYWDRVKVELGVLEDQNFSSYMLIVADYINWAKKRMPVGPARGSSAGSLVANLTGITDIDPIKHDLIFERFHNKQKKSFPDIDTDFSDPSMVKEYIKEKYGSDKVASISNWSTLSPKVVIKDVARSLRLGGDKSSAFKISNHITSIMPDSKTLQSAMKDSPQFSAYMSQYPELYEYGEKLQNLTRNWSVHAAGMVISDNPLYETVPLRIDEAGGVVTQWEKTRCETNGLIKMDLLGLKTLAVIDNTFKSIENTLGESLSIKDIDLEDQETYKMLGRGGTSGVFQLESSLTPYCIKLKPVCVSDISDINALGRPSCQPAERRKYAKRRLGVEAVVYDHPRLERALKSTYGILIYEEQALFIAQDCAGWDLNQADSLRKISKLKGKDPKLVLKTEASFVRDCMEHSGMDYKTACLIWTRYIEPLGGYAFNKSHSISYSHISFYTAWLRRHYPTQFMCSLINSEDPNSDKAQEYLSGCKSLGIEIINPNVNDSVGSYRVIEQGKMSTGLSAIKGLGDKAIDSIVTHQPFDSFMDFVSRNDSRTVGKTAIQALSKAGALDMFGLTRKDMHDNYQKYRSKAKNAVKKEVEKDILDQIPSVKKITKDIRDKYFSKFEISEDSARFREIVSNISVAKLEEEWDRKDILLGEREVLGRAISGNLHEVFRAFFSGGPMITPLSQVKFENNGARVKIEAIIKTKIKEFKIKNGKNVGRKFAKYLVEDVNGDTCGLTLWAEDYERYKADLKDGLPIKAICKVNEYMEQKDLALSSLERVYGRKI